MQSPAAAKAAAKAAKFIGVSLKTLRVDVQVSFDLYLETRGEYVLYRHRSLPFDVATLRSLQTNGVERLYVDANSSSDLATYFEDHLASIVQDESVPTSERAQSVVRVADALARDLIHHPDGAAIDRSTRFVKHLASLVAQRPSSLSRLIALVGTGTTLASHSVNTSIFAVAMADAAPNLSVDTIAELAAAGFLHDVALGLVPPEILRKPGGLDSDERALVEEHPVTGALMLRQLGDLPGSVTQAVRWHHERLDGSGYPDALRGSEIPWMARAVAIAEIFDALTSVQPYRPALTPYEAMRLMLGDMQSQLDGPLVRGFIPQLLGRASPDGDD